MKLKENLLLRQVAGSWVVVAVGMACVSFDGMLTLNETGAVLWKALETGTNRDGLIAALTSEYEVTAERAGADVDNFLTVLNQAGCLED